MSYCLRCKKKIKKGKYCYNCRKKEIKSYIVAVLREEHLDEEEPGRFVGRDFVENLTDEIEIELGISVGVYEVAEILKKLGVDVIWSWEP